MLKLCILILKNLGRNKLRTTVTGLAVVVLVAIFTIVSGIIAWVNGLLDNEGSETRLLVAERWEVPSLFPIRYVAELAAIPGVEDWTPWHAYLGYFDETEVGGKPRLGVATRVGNLVQMHPGLEELSPDVLERWSRTKSAVLISKRVMEDMHWRIGQRFRFLSTSHQGKNLEFEIVGMLPAGRWEGQFFFRQDYFLDATGQADYVNWTWIKVADAEMADRVAADIQRRFEKRDPSLRVQTESASMNRVAARNKTVMSIIDLVVMILLVDMVIVLSNSISITTRERRKEMAVLKILGFQPRDVLFLVIGEATLVGTLSGIVGTTAAYTLAWVLGGIALESQFMAVRVQIPASMVIWGMAIGASVGFLGSVIPAWSVQGVKVTEVFSDV